MDTGTAHGEVFDIGITKFINQLNKQESHI